MKIQIKETISAKELAKQIGLSITVINLHLCKLDKYRIGRRNHFLYLYNGCFLRDLLNLFISITNNYDGKKKEKYILVVQKINKLFELWNKGEQYRNAKTTKQD